LNGKIRQQSNNASPLPPTLATSPRPSLDEARPLPGSPEQAPPNSTELREREQRKRQIWKSQSPHLPLTPDEPAVPFLPDWMKGNK
jgi:hypothetical protein